MAEERESVDGFCWLVWPRSGMEHAFLPLPSARRRALCGFGWRDMAWTPIRRQQLLIGEPPEDLARRCGRCKRTLRKGTAPLRRH